MKKRNNIAFRRIKGRIVPIRVKEGAFDLTAGVATGAAAGAASSAMLRADKAIMPPLARMATAARFRKAGSIFGRKKSWSKQLFGKVASVKNAQKAMRYGFRASAASKKLAPAVFLGGALTGSVLAATGISKLSGEYKDSTTSKVGQVGAAATAVGAANYSFLRAGGNSHRRSMAAGIQMVPPAIRRVLKMRF